MHVLCRAQSPAAAASRRDYIATSTVVRTSPAGSTRRTTCTHGTGARTRLGNACDDPWSDLSVRASRQQAQALLGNEKKREGGRQAQPEMKRTQQQPADGDGDARACL